MIEIHCDGACSGNQFKTNVGGWGTVLKFADAVKELSGHARNTTNNKMELTALLMGLRAITNRKHSLRIFSDSAYIVNCFNDKWYVGWRKRGWLNSKKQPVENKALWQEILDLMEQHPQVNAYKVKGHLDLADQTAIKKWHSKCVKDYGIDMPFDVYQQAIVLNARVDELANIAMASIQEQKNETNDI